MNVYVREVSVQLANIDHQIDIYTRSTGSQNVGEHDPPPENVRVISLPGGPHKDTEKSRLAGYIPEFAEGFLHHTVREKISYDLIHGHYWMSGLVAVELKKTLDFPMVLMLHTLGLMKNRIAALSERESEERIRGERLALATADKVVASTPAELAELQWLYEVPSTKITVVPPGVDPKLFHPIDQKDARTAINVPQDCQLILYVGRVEPLKGIDTLIQALKLHVEKTGATGRKLLVHIIGGNTSRSDRETNFDLAPLRKLVNEFGLDEQIHFLGKQPQRDLPNYYAAADVVVVPSYYESFGLVALEAMACGTPVIASRVGGLTYLVQDGLTGFHVPESDADALQDSLQKLLSDRKRLDSMGSAAARFAQKYSWRKTAEELSSLYGELLAG